MPLYHQTFQGLFPVDKDFVLHIHNAAFKIGKFNIVTVVQIHISNSSVVSIMAFIAIFPFLSESQNHTVLLFVAFL